MAGHCLHEGGMTIHLSRRQSLYAGDLSAEKILAKMGIVTTGWISMTDSQKMGTCWQDQIDRIWFYKGAF